MDGRGFPEEIGNWRRWKSHGLVPACELEWPEGKLVPSTEIGKFAREINFKEKHKFCFWHVKLEKHQEVGNAGL